MIFEPTPVDGVLVVHPRVRSDERGSFARIACEQEFAENGLDGRFVQCSVSCSRRAGTLRGMHWQQAPHEENKLVRCLRGAVYDVALDLRPGSPTYKSHVGRTLRDDEGTMLYVPRGCAHGFLTLEDDAEVLYMISAFHEPGSARGVRWNDPAFGIAWPAPVTTISDRDASYDDFQE